MKTQKITDEKPVSLKSSKPDKVKILLDGLSKGECKGVKGAIAYKIAEYAQKKGLI